MFLVKLRYWDHLMPVPIYVACGAPHNPLDGQRVGGAASVPALKSCYRGWADRHDIVTQLD